MKRPHTVLVVDDEPDVVQSVQGLLRLEFRVLGATRAKEGLEIMRREEVHVVMSDQRMPEMTGVEFLQRAIAIQPSAKRLLLTAYADVEAIVHAAERGGHIGDVLVGVRGGQRQGEDLVARAFRDR